MVMRPYPALVAFALLGAGCLRDPADCVLTCGPGDPCPGPFVCNMDLLCVHPGVSCPPPGGSSSSSGGTSSTSGGSGCQGTPACAGCATCARSGSGPTCVDGGWVCPPCGCSSSSSSGSTSGSVDLHGCCTDARHCRSPYACVASPDNSCPNGKSCCAPSSAPCQYDADCCPGNSCQQNVCTPCPTNEGAGCGSDTDCGPAACGLTCQSGVGASASICCKTTESAACSTEGNPLSWCSSSAVAGCGLFTYFCCPSSPVGGSGGGG